MNEKDKVTNIEDARAKRAPRLRGDCFGYMTWGEDCEPVKPVIRALLHEDITILNGVIEAEINGKQENVEEPKVTITYTLPGGRNATEEIPAKGRLTVPHFALPAGSRITIQTNFFGVLWVSLKYKAG